MASRALALAAAEKARAAARLRASLLFWAPQSMHRGPCPRMPLPTSPFTLRAPPLLPTPMRPRTHPLLESRAPLLHFRCSFSTGANHVKNGASIVEDSDDPVAAEQDKDGGAVAGDLSGTSPVAAEQDADGKDGGAVADEKGGGDLSGTSPVAAEQDTGEKDGGAVAGDLSGTSPVAAKPADDLFTRLTKFIEENREHQEMVDKVARRNQSYIILGGVVIELVVVILGTIVVAGPFIFDYMKRKFHETVKEDSTKESIWYTMDNVFAYFGHKIASPFIMAGRGATVAGNTIRSGVRKVGVWLHVVKAEVLVETPEGEKAGFAKFWSMEGFNFKCLVGVEIVMKIGKAAGIGLAFGGVYGVLDSILHDGPQVGSNVKYPQLIRTAKAGGHCAANLAVVGATYVGIEQALARYRMKNDIINGAAAAFTAGAFLGFRVGSFRTAFFSGSFLALTSVVADVVTGMKTTDEEEKGNH